MAPVRCECHHRERPLLARPVGTHWTRSLPARLDYFVVTQFISDDVAVIDCFACFVANSTRLFLGSVFRARGLSHLASSWMLVEEAFSGCEQTAVGNQFTSGRRLAARTLQARRLLSPGLSLMAALRVG